MLHQLRSRLHAANFAVHFAIVTAERSDDDIMAELGRASAGIPLVSFDTLPESFGVRSGWNQYSNDIMVIDRCGRMTYQVVMPWSSLQYPYVKAAVISTLIDQPCGPCNATEKTPKLAESRTLNATQHEMKESSDKNQSKLVNIVNQYKPQREDGIAEGQEHVRDFGEITGDADIGRETNGSGTVEAVIEVQPSQLTEIPNAMEATSQTEGRHKHKVSQGDTELAETTEKMSRGKKKLSSKKHRSKQRSKHTEDDEIAEEQPQILPETDLELEKSVYSSAENYISSEVTLAPLRETKDGVIPIRVIMRSPHKHGGKTYDYLEMQLGNPGYHSHLEGEEREREQDLEEERKELQQVDDDFDAIGVEDKILEEERRRGDVEISGYGDGKDTGLNKKSYDGFEDKDLIFEHPEDSVFDAVKVDETITEGTSENNGAKKKNKKMEKEDKKGKDNKTKLANGPERKKEDDLISSYGDGEELGQDKKVVANDDTDAVLENAEKSVIDAVKVEETTPKPEVPDRNNEAKRKNKKTDKEGKKPKGNKTKLTNIPEQEWMTAEIKDIPDKFDDIYPQVNDFANDVREEESDHKNKESVLDGLTVTDLKYLIEEMGLEVNTTKEPFKSDAVVLASGDNKNASKDTNDDVVNNAQVPPNATEEKTGAKKGHHKYALNSVAVTEAADLAKNSKGKDAVAKGKESHEVVNRTKVTLAPTLAKSSSESTSSSDGTSKEVMEHYSKLLPWIDYHL